MTKSMKYKKYKIGLFIIIFALFINGCSNMMSSETILQLQDKCVEVSSRHITDINIDGTIAFQSISRDLILLNAKTGQEQSFSGAIALLTAISPDHTQLAYTNDRSRELVILASDGIQSIIPIRENWNGVIQWVDADSLMMNEFPENPYKKFTVATSSILYDIKTDEWYRISLSNYPNIRASVPTIDWGNHSYIRAVYDLSFSRVVYPAADEQYEPTLILWDIENEQKIIGFNQGYDNSVGGAPQWSQDGSFFIAGIYPQHRVGDDILYKNVPDDYPYEGGFELFQVGRDGKIKRLTYFTTKYNAGEEAFALSPDEKLIAFWLNLEYQPGDQNADRTLVILNIKTGEISNLCFVDGGKTPITPIWSPDGKYLVVSRFSPRENKDLYSDSVLIDIEQGEAIKIGENVLVKGWLTK